MSSTKRKKVTKYRGSKTHGCGSMKKRRGAGHRGGRGNAGSGKRGDSKKPSYWKSKTFGQGKVGFTSKSRTKSNAINLSDVQKRIDDLVAAGKLKEQKGVFTIDLAALGITKLLGSGAVTHKLHITVSKASPKAIAKVDAAGGAVKVLTADSQDEA